MSLFFSETTIAQAYGVAPYSANGTPDTSNAADGIYAETGGTSLVQMGGGPCAGYTGNVTLGLAGLPEEDGAEARLLGSAWTHDRRGRRRLRARLELGERMRSVQARLVREGSTLTSSRLTGVRSGTRALSVSVGRGVEPGPALLVIVARDRGWAVRPIRRRVRIPQRLG